MRGCRLKGTHGPGFCEHRCPDLTIHLGERDGKPAVEFTWDGHDEMDPAQGRGWMVLDGNELTGRLFIHLGDDSGIVLNRAA